MSTADHDLTRLHRDWGLSPSTLAPGCFASVMATGIVSIGAQIKGLNLLGIVLFWLAVVLYLFFIAMSLIRMVRYRDDLRADLHNPRRAFGFFTAVAGTNVLATGLIGQGMVQPAVVLFVIGALLWLVLGYGIPFTAILGSSLHPVSKEVNGTWLVWVVASQSVAVVASSLALKAAHAPFASEGLIVLLTLIAVVMWAVGLALYVVCSVSIFVRVLRHRFGPEDLDAPYWVTMGALAITIVAGSRILELEASPILDATSMIVGGSSTLLWAFSTWLIPALALAGAWRHFIHRIPMTYSAGLWSMVFPLGMYAVASMLLGQSDRLPAIEWIGQHWFWIGFIAWAIVFAAMIASFIRTIRDK